MKPGRNDPCTCGSGKKYKQCCLVAERCGGDTDSNNEIVWRRVSRVVRDYAPAMMRFIEETYGADAVDEAWDEFMLWEDDVPALDASTPHMQLFTPWFFHAWAPDPFDTDVEDAGLHDKSPTTVYLERRGRHLDPVLRRYLQACAESPLSFFEMTRVNPGHGFEATDIFTRATSKVLERSASRTLKTGEILFGQLVPIDGIVILEACSPFGFPPMRKLELMPLRERMMKLTGSIGRDDLRDWDIELRGLYLTFVDETLHPPIPELTNTDGDKVVMHECTFEVESAQAAFDALKHLAAGRSEQQLLADAARDPDGALVCVKFAWTRRANRKKGPLQNPVLGFIEIEGRKLKAQLNSVKRTAAFRRTVEKHLGDRARLVTTEVTDVREAMLKRRKAHESGIAGTTRAVDSGAAPRESQEELLQLPEVREKIREMMTKHYERWLHDKIPALGNRTPLQAVRSKEGREKVEALVAQIEHDSHAMNPPLDPSIVAMLRQRLKL